MTEQEAIEELKYDCGQAINTAYGMAISALQKRIPKRPDFHDNCGNKCASRRCPTCFEIVSGRYCENCGQALDWSKE